MISESTKLKKTTLNFFKMAAPSVSKVISTMLRTCCNIRHFNTSAMMNVKVVNWREEKGLPRAGTEYGPLTDAPDWSYADGKPAPLGSGQKRRVLQNIEYCKQIVKLTKEIDEAKMLTQQLKENEENKRKTFVNNMLKKKGDAPRPDQD